MNLVVDRKTWQRGAGTLGSLLTVSTDGQRRQQCMLGLILSACGVSDEDLTRCFCSEARALQTPELARLIEVDPARTNLVRAADGTLTIVPAHRVNALARELMVINDQPRTYDTRAEIDLAADHAPGCPCLAHTMIRTDGTLPAARFDAHRERLLAEKLGKVGIDVEFRG